MKKFVFILLAVFSTAVFVSSCGDQDQHILWISYPITGIADSISADENIDSICFITADSYKIIVPDSSQTWFHAYGDTATVTHDVNTRYAVTSYFLVDPNPNTTPRTCIVTVRSYGYTIQAVYVQRGKKK